MKKSLYIALGFLVIGGIGNVNAESRFYAYEDFKEAPLEKCWNIIAGNEPSSLIMKKTFPATGEDIEYYLVKDKVYRFTETQMITKPTMGFKLACDVVSFRTFNQ